MNYQKIRPYYHHDETLAVSTLSSFLELQKVDENKVEMLVSKLIMQARDHLDGVSGFAEMIHAYDISTDEGLALMCLAEALLRIPDQATAIDLIHDKLSHTDWNADHGNKGIITKFSSWGLSLTEKMIQPTSDKYLSDDETNSIFKSLFSKLSTPVILKTVNFSMKILGEHFVLGSTIEKALNRAAKNPDYVYSYDMLGEGAQTKADADQYFDLYREAIRKIGAAQKNIKVDKVFSYLCLPLVCPVPEPLESRLSSS